MEKVNHNIESANTELAANLQRIASMMKSLSPNLKQVAGEVTQVEELSKDILDYINSPGIGLSHNISRIDHAVALLGQRRTLALVERRLFVTEGRKVQADADSRVQGRNSGD